jgi:NAD(P)-dependent dehydrogenase (short-subunit alcohol dehydrogenase family)
MILESRVLLVTGASSGIGLAALRVFAEAGAVVIGVARNPSPAQPEVQRLVAEGHRVHCFSADIRRAGGIEEVVARIERDIGALDGAFNNASITQDACPIEEITEEVIDDILATNVKGTWRCLRAQIAVMKPRRRGAIVNTGSIAGTRGYEGLAAYSASKHAIIGLTRCAALDAAPHGIRVNCLCPGTTRTAMLERQMLTRPGGEQKTLDAIPLHRFATPAEQAQAAAWLLSDQSGFVTGETLVVDGGRTIR